MTFEEAIAPETVDSFVDRQLDKKWVILQGDARRFQDLVPWKDLNVVLNGFRMPTGSQRLRLVKSGKAIPVEEYLKTGHRWGAFLQAGSFERHLADGATLVLDGVEEFFPEVQQLTTGAEHVLKRYAWTNLYSGWGKEVGFDLHWDDHDTIIVQISGRKAWTVYAPTCKFPHKDFGESWNKPTDLPVWKGILNAGSLLYMPRGWWHYAQALGEPTMHITIGLRALAGNDVLEWLAGQLAKVEVYRMNVPLFSDKSDRTLYLSRLRKAIDTLLSTDCLDEIKRHVDASMDRRSPIDLQSAQETLPMIRLESILLLSGKSRLDLTFSPAGRLKIRSEGLVNESSPELYDRLSRLSTNCGIRFDDLSSGLDVPLKSELKLVLAALFLQGRVLVRNIST